MRTVRFYYHSDKIFLIRAIINATARISSLIVNFQLYIVNCLESSLQIGYDVINMLRSDRKAYGVRVNVLLVKLFLRELGMSGCGGVDNQRFHIGNIRKQ